MSHNKSDQEIIKTIIAMAEMLNIETVAEGVETQEQHDFLIGQGCRTMQGYLMRDSVRCEPRSDRADRKPIH